MKSLILYFSLLVIPSISCTEYIDIETTNSDSVIAIYGVITNETAYQWIEISRSSSYFDTVPNLFVSGANITITSLDGKESWTLKERAKGLYRTERRVAGRVESSYKLNVSCDFNNDGVPEEYDASATILKPFQIDSLKINSMDLLGRHYFNILLYAPEPLGTDYYLCKFYINGGLATALIKWYIVINDKLIDGAYLDGLLIYSFSDQNNEGEYDPGKVLFVKSGDTITVEVNRIDKGYYDFISQCKSSRDGETPFFGGPPANIVTNFSPGAVGYFSAYSPARKSIIVP